MLPQTGLGLDRLFQHDGFGLLQHGLRSDYNFPHPSLAGDAVHDVEHQIFHDVAQTACSQPPVDGLPRDLLERLVGERQSDTFEFENLLKLFDQAVLRLSQNLDQSFFVQAFQTGNHRQAANFHFYRCYGKASTFAIA